MCEKSKSATDAQARNLEQRALFAMGAGASTIGQWKNDFELVIRATKEVRRL